MNRIRSGRERERWGLDTGGKEGQRNKREGGRMLEDEDEGLLRQAEDEAIQRFKEEVA